MHEHILSLAEKWVGVTDHQSGGHKIIYNKIFFIISSMKRLSLSSFSINNLQTLCDPSPDDWSDTRRERE